MAGLIVVTGATGHIGGGAARQLLGKGRKVRALGRSADKLKDLEALGAEPFVGDLGDAAAMKKAFAGAEAAFIMIPPNLGAKDFRAWQNEVGKVQAVAAADAGLGYVVHLSSVGAHLSQGAGPVNGLHDNEQRLDLLAANVLHLRPSYFMENLLNNIGLIKGMGINGSPMRPDVRVPLIATRDIAAVAARRLLELDFQGKQVQELLGPRDYTMAEATGILGQAIGRGDLKYVQFPYEDALKAMVGYGISPDVAGLFNEMNKGFNEGTVTATQPRSAQTDTPTTLEQFAQDVFAPAFAK